MQDKKKPRGGNNNPSGKGGFTGADDPRRNNNGQRSAPVVAFNRTVREVIAEVGNETLTKDSKQYSRLELAVRGLYVKASKGDVSAFNALVERVEGKVAQGVNHKFDDLSNEQLIADAANLVAGIAATIAGITGGNDAPGANGETGER